MSNPCINRWGLKSFWHHYWYSDTRYAHNLQQDGLILKLIRIYLTYGSTWDSRFFNNKFWYKTQPKSLNTPLSKYYRWTTTTCLVTGVVTTHRLRLSGPETFQSRINLLKFDSALVLNCYWFQPDKGQARRERGPKLYSSTTSVNPQSLTYSPLLKLKSAFTSNIYTKPIKANRYNF